MKLALPIKWVFVVAVSLGTQAIHAGSISKTYTLPGPPAQYLHAEPGRVELATGGTYEPDPTTNAAVFLIPKVDSNKFTITNVTIGFSGIIGGASWAYYDPSRNYFIGNILTQVKFTESDGLADGPANDQHVASASPPQGGASSIGLSVRSYETPVYSANSLNYMVNHGYFYLGSDPNDTNLIVPVSLDVWSDSTVYLPNSGTVAFVGGVVVFWFGVELVVHYDMLTISNATAADLPPDVPLNNPLQMQQAFGTNFAPMPNIPDLPQFVYDQASMQIASVQRTNDDIIIRWRAVTGSTNYVQAGSSLSDFTDVSGPIVPLSTNALTSASYLYPGGATNGPNRFYRIRQQMAQ